MRWFALGVLVVQVLLVWTGLVDLGEAIAVALALELVAAVVAVTLAVTGSLEYRRLRADGATREDAAFEALRPVVPGAVLSVLRHEYGVFGSIWRAARRRPALSPGATPVPYGRDVTPFIALFAGLSVVELVAVHLLVPWHWLRVLLFVAGVYGLLWVIGLLCSIQVRPHQVDRSALLLRFAHVAQVTVPAAAVVSAAPRLSSGHRRTVDVGDGHLALPVNGTTNVTVQLRPGTVVTTGHGRRHAVDAVSFLADEPSVAVRAVEAARRDG